MRKQTKTSKVKTIVKPLKKLKKDLWTVFSQYVRLRDKGVCFSCQKKIPDYYNRNGDLKEGWKAGQGGHFITGAICHPELYFHEQNVHCQCYHCNINLSGNWFNYERRMIEAYGSQAVIELKQMIYRETNWTHEDYETKIKHYKQEVKALGG